MKVSELYNSVAQLGFSDSLEDNARFIFATNRALLQVCKLAPTVKTFVLNHAPVKALIGFTEQVSHTSGTLSYETAGAVAYTFEACGKGVCRIEYAGKNGEWLICAIVPINTAKQEYVRYYGFIKDQGGSFVGGAVRICFDGEYKYAIKNLALYAHIESDDVEDIEPYGTYSKYDLHALIPSAMAICSPPMDERNKIIGDFRMHGEWELLLPRKKGGSYTIMYHAMPDKVTVDDLEPQYDKDIDLGEELCSLLPLLVASYVWVEDAPDKAEYYATLYNARAIEIERKKIKNAPIEYKNIYGW